ncbi:TIGR04211 family SH3 domain-containing protein [Marinomonas sp. 15G1-11]|uniref:TIGR04211 family SH3 domain-containing protein n=1 Tax=Marinomonas phaeophyticola TaxID=3004091 RepID=A0ABT4JZF4_9GAMM|nr:TIGR04211 family SH3 domain-containing protein [Marinomonas sp. 15G1-11]MCZ2723482.1 TIGR04211 family SH3 domain-containing protein [Marinomonas sp. 15G1-11]
MFYKFIAGFFISVALSSSLMAATVYVSDIQFVAIREGQSNNSRATERGIKSGTPLEVLSKSENYTRVRTPSGNIGWVANYFLSDDKVSRDELIDLQTQITSLSETKITLQDKLDDATALVDTLKTDVTTLATEKEAIEKRLNELNELTQEAQEIVSRNDENVFAIASLEQRLISAQEKADRLQSSHEQKWFMIGAGTLLGGLVIGVLVPLNRRKKVNNSSWS